MNFEYFVEFIEYEFNTITRVQSTKTISYNFVRSHCFFSEKNDFRKTKIRSAKTVSTTGMLIVGGIILGIAILIIIPTVLGVVLSRNPTGNYA